MSKISFPMLLIAFLVVVSVNCSTVTAFGAGNIGKTTRKFQVALALITRQLRSPILKGEISVMETYVAAALTTEDPPAY